MPIPRQKPQPSSPPVESKADKESRILFLARCPNSITTEAVQEYYSSLGLELDKVEWGEWNGKFKNYGFAFFKTSEMAQAALRALPPKFDDQRIAVSVNTRGTTSTTGASANSREDPAENQSQLFKKKGWSPAKMAKLRILKNLSCVLKPSTDTAAIKEFRDKNAVTLGVEVTPVLSFSEIQFGCPVQGILTTQFTAPTAIQSQAWPCLLHGRDVIGLAKPGSGKTLAYLLPALLHAQANRATADIRLTWGPTVLILAPMRELVIQISDEVRQFGIDLELGLVYGGAGGGGNRTTQKSEMQRPLDIVAACSGRLIEFIENHTLRLERVSMLVVDEADKFLQSQNRKHLVTIVAGLRPDHQTAMFTSVWNPDLQRLATKLLSFPITVSANQALDERANPDVTQEIIFAGRFSEKVAKLQLLLKRMRSFDDGRSVKTLVFVNSKQCGDELVEAIRPSFPKVELLHAEFSQDWRESVAQRMREDPTAIVIATNVACRGLHIPDLPFVVNFDMANNIQDYIHRIGRTGRAGATGTAYTFFTDLDAGLARPLMRCMESVSQEPPQLLAELCARHDAEKAEKRAKKRATRVEDGTGTEGQPNPVRKKQKKKPTDADKDGQV
eukprot:NODE_176_length_2102_cov_278.550901_g139_i0.p1 GENE.NODE_176_length_2102_cov_278.550901_g139_i0~~NODE_176_length_2102_cov_278.550901_g139_i0.p1  ORF type:complete len:615 (+),score=178.48 NODE_176_length_2102_cov_278.550901_g139_i0:70-1914(+)